MPGDFTNPTLVLLVVALAAGPVTAVCGWRRPAWAAPVAVAATSLAFATALWGWARGGDPIDLRWAPTWGLRLIFQLDGLAILYSLLATGVGLAVVLYATAYIPLHLQHETRPPADATRFFGFLLFFMGSMVGLVMAQDLFLIFVFWDLTAIASYFLIGYDSQKPDARYAALTALLVTGISAVCYLIGALILFDDYGTFSLPRLASEVTPGQTLTAAGLLMAVAGLAKSAQAPLHFWLPRAMAAPTPVSAYLHSAAMVAAGVFLLSRLYPLLEPSQAVLDLLLVAGFFSIFTGGLIALTRNTLKQLLAYSTISQYGYVVVMLGFGGRYGVAGASFYVLVHALMKSALFLTAGTVTEATGETVLSGVGGLARRMPLLALGSGLAAAGLAAFPLTAGFFKDELFFSAALDRGGIAPWLCVAGASLTLAYTWRFWAGIFLGQRRTEPKPVPVRLVAPVAALGGLVLLVGVWPAPFERLAVSAGRATVLRPIDVHLAYHLDTRTVNLLALAVFGCGAAIVVTRRIWSEPMQSLARETARYGPRWLFDAGLVRLNRASDAIHRIEVRDLRSRVATILLPAGILVGAALLVQPQRSDFSMGAVRWTDVPLIVVLVVAALSAGGSTLTRSHLGMSLVLSGVGYSLAVAYALLHAPDVALVAVLIETTFTILLLAMLTLLPVDRDVTVLPRRETRQEFGTARTHPRRDRLLGLIAGLFALFVSWSVLSKPAALETVAVDQIVLTPAAHGKDVVTVILADFRGLDTMGEITVIGVGFLGIATLLRRWRPR